MNILTSVSDSFPALTMLATGMMFTGSATALPVKASVFPLTQPAVQVVDTNIVFQDPANFVPSPSARDGADATSSGQSTNSTTLVTGNQYVDTISGAGKIASSANTSIATGIVTDIISKLKEFSASSTRGSWYGAGGVFRKPPALRDTTNPTVMITVPVQGATVTGLATITVVAADDVRVAGVRIYANGQQIGELLTSVPYTVSWDTAAVADGDYQIVATAYDATGNIATSAPVFIEVQNPLLNNPNLIRNPSLEVATDASRPDSWNASSWGTNNAVFAYPTAGATGSRAAASINIATYTDGDAKWFFDEVRITPNTAYVFSDYYRSNVTSSLVARYTYADGSYSYDILAEVSPSESWVKTSVILVTPPAATAMTVFHAISSVGSLSVDRSFLAERSLIIPASHQFSRGMVSLSFDDGWETHYTVARPMLNARSMRGQFGILTSAMLGSHVDLMLRPGAVADMSTTTGTAGTEWGPIYSDSSLNHFVLDIPYEADVSGTLSVQYVNQSGAAVTMTVGSFPAGSGIAHAEFTLMPRSSENGGINLAFNVPAATAYTVGYPSFVQINDKYVTPEQVRQMHAEGHEISVHTRTHPQLTTLTPEQLESETVGARQDLLDIGIPSPDILVYPFGNYDTVVKQYAAGQGFIAGRSVEAGYNTLSSDKFALKVQNVLVTTTLVEVKAWVEAAAASKTWLILVFHQIDDSGEAYSTTAGTFGEIVEYLAGTDVPVVTLKEGVDQMNQ